MKKYLVVRRSPLHGRGLFAARDIPMGRELGKCTVVPSSSDTCYTLWLDDGLRAVEVLCKFRYINHSKRPNVAYFDDLTVVALKDIEAGEELLHDYGDDWGV